jgi:hypothetical protein
VLSGIATSCNEEQLAETGLYSHSYSRLLPALVSVDLSRARTSPTAVDRAPKKVFYEYGAVASVDDPRPGERPIDSAIEFAHPTG